MLEQRELHVGEHELVVALRDEQSARELGRVDRRARRRRARRRPSGRRPGAPTRDRRTTRPATSSTSTVASARSSATARSATAGLPGTAYTTSPCSCAAATRRVDDLAVRRLEVGSGVVDVVERRERHSGAARSSTAGCRSVRTYRCVADSSAARATGRRWSAPAGPRPTATIRSAIVRASRRWLDTARGSPSAGTRRPSGSSSRTRGSIVHVGLARPGGRRTRSTRVGVLQTRAHRRAAERRRAALGSSQAPCRSCAAERPWAACAPVARSASVTFDTPLARRRSRTRSRSRCSWSSPTPTTAS